jgi:endoglucanase
MIDTTELLRQLSQAAGVTGYEDDVRALVREALTPLADEFRTDALGNLIAVQYGEGAEPRPAIMLAAHMDEIGLMVSGFEGSFLRFHTVGGVDLRTLPGQEVTVHGVQPLPGIVASLPPHVLSPEERSKPVPLDKLFIDVGLDAETVRQRVHVGDLITMRRDFLPLAGNYVSGKAFDDRAGIVSLAVCLEMLRGMRHSWDVYAVATTQEEIGLRGATVSAYGLAPDIAIAVDVGFGKQQGVSDSKIVEMDAGPAIAMGPNVHPLMHQRLVATAKRHELKYQTEVIAGASGTDGWAIQVAREGIPTAVLSIPLRYMHTTVETLCTRDIERTGRLMALFIAGLDDAFAADLGLQKGASA